MAQATMRQERRRLLPAAAAALLRRRMIQAGGLGLFTLAAAMLVAIAGYSPGDPVANLAAPGPVRNPLGPAGAEFADAMLRGFGLVGLALPLLIGAWGWRLLVDGLLPRFWLRAALAPPALVLLSCGMATASPPAVWPLAEGLGGVVGLVGLARLADATSAVGLGAGGAAWLAGAAGLALILFVAAIRAAEYGRVMRGLGRGARFVVTGGLARLPALVRNLPARPRPRLRVPSPDPRDLFGRLTRARAPEEAPPPPEERQEPVLTRARGRRTADTSPPRQAPADDPAPVDAAARVAVETGDPAGAPEPTPDRPVPRRRSARAGRQADLPLDDTYQLPPLDLLQQVVEDRDATAIDREALEDNARRLEGVLKDFGVKGEIVKVRPGPVVTLYELEPAPGTKSSRVIGLADDLARNMSAVSVRVSTIPGRSVMGIELPNENRQMVLLRELLESREYTRMGDGLPLALGKDIGGSPIVVNLERMPHLLIAGTTGSGKSVAINTMILSLLYRFTPEECRLIMIDPKMLELSVYDDIPHLLSPVVTDPKKAVVALKWVVREMENRYRAMSTLGVRNIRGYNARIREALGKGEVLMRRVQTGFDPDTRKPVYEEHPLDMTPLPYVVVVVDEMADLMLVAGKDIEAAIQRLAQMARAAGIHLIMATQRPSVDVITGTIKANFPTRVSFQVTSKIDSRTILGEGGAEQLLGQGDMLYMAGGGRISRVHGPFVDDDEVADVVQFLKRQGPPTYVDSVTEDEDVAEGIPGFEITTSDGGDGEGSDDLYDRAVALVLRERKASTSFVQRHLQIGYNRAARLIERMESEGVVSSANHVGKREILVGSDID